MLEWHMAAHLLALFELLRWPLAVFGLGVTALYVYRAPVGSLLSRLTKVKAPGIEAEASDQTQAQAEAQATKTHPEPAELVAVMQAGGDSFASKLLVEVAKSILRDPIVTSTPSGDAREQLLARHLASSQIALFFERVYQYIFGSQIQALRLANGGLGVSITELRSLYGKSFSESEIPFERWLQYIHGYAEMISIDGDRAHITERGQEFLKYLVQMRYTDKPWS